MPFSSSFFPDIPYLISSNYDLVSSLQLSYRLGRSEGRVTCPPKHMTRKSVHLNSRSINPEASHTNESEETTSTDDRSQPAGSRPARRSRLQTPPQPNPPLTRKTQIQLCATLWDSRSQPVVTYPGIEPGCVMTPQALRCNALDHCIRPLLPPLLPSGGPLVYPFN
jgi:hypothetical protein